jgi:hypothetical protein
LYQASALSSDINLDWNDYTNLEGISNLVLAQALSSHPIQTSLITASTSDADLVLKSALQSCLQMVDGLKADLSAFSPLFSSLSLNNNINTDLSSQISLVGGLDLTLEGNQSHLEVGSELQSDLQIQTTLQNDLSKRETLTNTLIGTINSQGSLTANSSLQVLGDTYGHLNPSLNQEILFSSEAGLTLGLASFLDSSIGLQTNLSLEGNLTPDLRMVPLLNTKSEGKINSQNTLTTNLSLTSSFISQSGLGAQFETQPLYLNSQTDLVASLDGVCTSDINFTNTLEAQTQIQPSLQLSSDLNFSLESTSNLESSISTSIQTQVTLNSDLRSESTSSNNIILFGSFNTAYNLISNLHTSPSITGVLGGLSTQDANLSSGIQLKSDQLEISEFNFDLSNSILLNSSLDLRFDSKAVLPAASSPIELNSQLGISSKNQAQLTLSASLQNSSHLDFNTQNSPLQTLIQGSSQALLESELGLTTQNTLISLGWEGKVASHNEVSLENNIDFTSKVLVTGEVSSLLGTYIPLGGTLPLRGDLDAQITTQTTLTGAELRESSVLSLLPLEAELGAWTQFQSCLQIRPNVSATLGSTIPGSIQVSLGATSQPNLTSVISLISNLKQTSSAASNITTDLTLNSHPGIEVSSNFDLGLDPVILSTQYFTTSSTHTQLTNNTPLILGLNSTTNVSSWLSVPTPIYFTTNLVQSTNLTSGSLQVSKETPWESLGMGTFTGGISSEINLSTKLLGNSFSKLSLNSNLDLNSIEFKNQSSLEAATWNDIENTSSIKLEATLRSSLGTIILLRASSETSSSFEILTFSNASEATSEQALVINTLGGLNTQIELGSTNITESSQEGILTLNQNLSSVLPFGSNLSAFALRMDLSAEKNLNTYIQSRNFLQATLSTTVALESECSSYTVGTISHFQEAFTGCSSQLRAALNFNSEAPITNIPLSGSINLGPSLNGDILSESVIIGSLISTTIGQVGLTTALPLSANLYHFSYIVPCTLNTIPSGDTGWGGSASYRGGLSAQIALSSVNHIESNITARIESQFGSSIALGLSSELKGLLASEYTLTAQDQSILSLQPELSASIVLATNTKEISDLQATWSAIDLSQDLQLRTCIQGRALIELDPFETTIPLSTNLISQTQVQVLSSEGSIPADLNSAIQARVNINPTLSSNIDLVGKNSTLSVLLVSTQNLPVPFEQQLEAIIETSGQLLTTCVLQTTLDHLTEIQPALEASILLSTTLEQGSYSSITQVTAPMETWNNIQGYNSSTTIIQSSLSNGVNLECGLVQPSSITANSQPASYLNSNIVLSVDSYPTLNVPLDVYSSLVTSTSLAVGRLLSQTLNWEDFKGTATLESQLLAPISLSTGLISVSNIENQLTTQPSVTGHLSAFANSSLSLDQSIILGSSLEPSGEMGVALLLEQHLNSELVHTSTLEGMLGVSGDIQSNLTLDVESIQSLTTSIFLNSEIENSSILSIQSPVSQGDIASNNQLQVTLTSELSHITSFAGSNHTEALLGSTLLTSSELVTTIRPELGGEIGLTSGLILASTTKQNTNLTASVSPVLEANSGIQTCIQVRSSFNANLTTSSELTGALLLADQTSGTLSTIIGFSGGINSALNSAFNLDSSLSLMGGSISESELRLKLLASHSYFDGKLTLTPEFHSYLDTNVILESALILNLCSENTLNTEILINNTQPIVSTLGGILVTDSRLISGNELLLNNQSELLNQIELGIDLTQGVGLIGVLTSKSSLATTTDLSSSIQLYITADIETPREAASFEGIGTLEVHSNTQLHTQILNTTSLTQGSNIKVTLTTEIDLISNPQLESSFKAGSIIGAINLTEGDISSSEMVGNISSNILLASDFQQRSKLSAQVSEASLEAKAALQTNLQVNSTLRLPFLSKAANLKSITPQMDCSVSLAVLEVYPLLTTTSLYGTGRPSVIIQSELSAHIQPTTTLQTLVTFQATSEDLSHGAVLTSSLEGLVEPLAQAALNTNITLISASPWNDPFLLWFMDKADLTAQTFLSTNMVHPSSLVGDVDKLDLFAKITLTNTGLLGSLGSESKIQTQTELGSKLILTSRSENSLTNEILFESAEILGSADITTSNLYVLKPVPLPTWGGYVPYSKPKFVQGLIILNSAHHGARDLYWSDIEDPHVHGYNVYRSEDHQNNWKKLNITPVPGNRYRDQIEFENVTYVFDLEKDWIEKGEFGSWRLRVKGETFWSSAIPGRPSIAESVQDILLLINGVAVTPSRIIGMEGEVWLPVDAALARNAIDTTYPIFAPDSIQEVAIVYRRLKNNINLYLTTHTFYTVVPVDVLGQEIHKPGMAGSEVKSIMDVDSMDYMQAEMIRRNAWLFEQVGEPAWLLVRRTKGSPCACVNPETHEPKTGCRVCHEVGLMGGYYGPIDFLFIDPDQALTKTVDEGGIKVERPSRSYLGPTPLVKNGDLIIRKNGERLVIGNVTYKSPRGVLLQQEFDAHLLNPGSTKYLIPTNFFDPTPELVYHPAFVSDRIHTPAEPISTPEVDPTKKWENKDRKPMGRTTTFTRIMS